MRQFDQHADAYDAVRGRIAYPDRLFTLLKERCFRHDAALDLGCGNGVSTVRLAEHFDHVEGVDLGGNLIARAQQNYPTLKFTVAAAEEFTSDRRFDLVTCATSFYWMDRDVVLRNLEGLLAERSVFCAYKYDFPIANGPLQELIERELVTRWDKHRDQRLTSYDDSLERIQRAGYFTRVERQLIPNTIELTPRQVALFFLSTSYVTRYMDQEGGEGYVQTLLDAAERADSSAVVKMNFDIQSFIGQT
jgi:ubiquinone/menaquinone biosynthesis C-methylase UbiE